MSLNKNTLFNISTGQEAKSETAKYLLGVEKFGKKLKNEFIDECTEDMYRFENTRKLVKIRTFANEKIVKKITVGSQVKNVVIQRDIWGTLLAVTIKHDISVALALSYPLSPFPFVFARSDGAISKTTKSALTAHLERITTLPENDSNLNSSDFTRVIYDGFCLLHKMTNVPEMYGDISNMVLEFITKNEKLK